MAGFDPDKPARVYNSLNEEFFDWDPANAADYRKWARPFRGTDEVDWDGIMLLGWRRSSAIATDARWRPS